MEENPLRVLDSKEKEDKVAVENAPSILDFLDEESQAHFDAVRQMLENLGVDYIIDYQYGAWSGLLQSHYFRVYH